MWDHLSDFFCLRYQMSCPFGEGIVVPCFQNFELIFCSQWLNNFLERIQGPRWCRVPSATPWWFFPYGLWIILILSSCWSVLWLPQRQAGLLSALLAYNHSLPLSFCVARSYSSVSGEPRFPLSLIITIFLGSVQGEMIKCAWLNRAHETGPI